MGERALVRCGHCGVLNRIPAEGPHERARCGRCRTPLGGGAETVTTVTDVTFARAVLKAPIPVLVDCWAPWCGPCRTLGPVIDAIAQAYASRAQVAKLNVDDNPATAARYGIQGIPMLLLFHQGQLMDRLVGAHPRPVIEARLEAVLGAAAR